MLRSRLLKKLIWVSTLALSMALGLRLLDTYLSLTVTLPVVLALVVLHHAFTQWLDQAPASRFAPVRFSQDYVLESSKDHRVRTIEDDLYRAITTSHASPTLAVKHLADIHSQLAALAATSGRTIELSESTARLLNISAQSTPQPVNRKLIVAAIKELDAQYSRVQLEKVDS